MTGPAAAAELHVRPPEVVLRNLTFPRWAGPVVGVWAGVYVQIRQTALNRPVEWELVGIGAGCGLLGGLVIFLADVPPADPPQVSTTGGELLAAAGWLVVLLPGVNVLVNAASALANRGAADWPGKWSRVGLGCSVVLTSVWVGLLADRAGVPVPKELVILAPANTAGWCVLGAPVVIVWCRMRRCGSAEPRAAPDAGRG